MTSRKTVFDMKKELLKLWVLICVMSDKTWRQRRRTHKQDFTVVFNFFWKCFNFLWHCFVHFSWLSKADLPLGREAKSVCTIIILLFYAFVFYANEPTEKLIKYNKHTSGFAFILLFISSSSVSPFQPPYHNYCSALFCVVIVKCSCHLNWVIKR